MFSPLIDRNKGDSMYTISNILEDIDRGCTANNLNEDRFRYRIIFFVNDGCKGTKHYADTMYGGLRESLENIIRNHLSLTNTVVIAQTTVLKGGECVCLQSKAYSFSLEEYFNQISVGCKGSDRNNVHGRYAVRCMNG